MSESSLAVGARVGPYEILSLLGQGGMGQVYKARDLRLSREVAIKVLLTDLPSDKDRRLRFEDEAKAASLLSHPNIVAVYDIGDSNGSPYIVSELLQGETLRYRLLTGPFPPRKAVEHGIQILRGLAAAHDKGIVHRDLKPENLFLTKDGLVKILDFGIAKLGRHGEERAGSDVETRSHTSAGTMVGTVGYMSPEQVRGLVVDQRSDLFSFGAVLYEMLAGKRAFRGTTVADTLSAILREDPTEASTSGPGLPAGLVRVVRRSLEKSPDDRFQTARDLAFALEGAATDSNPPVTASSSPGRHRRHWKVALAVGGLVAVAALGAFGAHLMAPVPVPPSFQRLTFRIGYVNSAHFGLDGETILYSAKWGNNPTELFSTRASTRGERSLALTDALILSVSSREEMALLLRPRAYAVGAWEGMLARAPMAGGATPREILEGVLRADWSPDGKDLAVVHVVGERYRLEYPVGRVLYTADPPTWISFLRVSPKGDQVAFVENPVARDNRGTVAIVDREGRKRILASGLASLAGLGWSPTGDEVWFGTGRTGNMQQVRAVSLSGRQRIIEEVPGAFTLLDVSRSGQILGSRETTSIEIRARARGAPGEAELPASDYSFLSDLSDDGKLVLGTDVGDGGGPNFRFYVQKTDGSPALWLGEGDGQALSPDGRSALAVLLNIQPQQLIVVPTGAGEARTLEPGPVAQYPRAVWDNTGRRVVFAGVDKQDSLRVYVQDVAGGLPKAVTGDGVGLAQIGRPVSPDGQRVAAVGPDGVPAIYPLTGGEPVAIPGLDDHDVALCWTPDGREIMVARYEETEETPPRIARVEVASGRTRPWNRIDRATTSTGLRSARILVSPDGESYAYGYLRTVSDLYLTSKLK
jgi:eukaryotic-like serine/threonine-protein kinase